jgi:hypothetical protein
MRAGRVMAFLIHYCEPIEYGNRTMTLHHFVSRERDPITGMRHWVDTPGEAEHYEEEEQAHSDQTLYGGEIISDSKLYRMGLRPTYGSMAVAGWTRLEESGAEIGMEL